MTINPRVKKIIIKIINKQRLQEERNISSDKETVAHMAKPDVT